MVSYDIITKLCGRFKLVLKIFAAQERKYKSHYSKKKNETIVHM